MEKLHIIFRSCAVVKSLNPAIRRPFNLEKDVLILKSLKSLLESCLLSKEKIRIDIIDDSSGKNFLNQMEKILKKYPFEFKIHSLNFRNNGKSLEFCYKLAESSKSNLLYFCEDDYVHLKNSILWILETYKSKLVGSSEFAVFPIDCPDRYGELYPSYIFKGNHCHWRSVAHTTGTFFITKKGFQKYLALFAAFADHNKKSWGGEDETINKIWKEFPCISPIKSLAIHLDGGELPPFVPWKKIVGEIKLD